MLEEEGEEVRGGRARELADADVVAAGVGVARREDAHRAAGGRDHGAGHPRRERGRV